MTATIEEVKRQAKRIARATTVTHAQALDVLAVQNGFSHWSAYGRHLAAGLAPSFNSNAGSVQGMLERMLGKAIPAIDGCRHLIVSGIAGAGKTVFVNKLLAASTAGTRVIAVEDVHETRLPPGGVTIAPVVADRERGHAQAIEKALSMVPDIVICTLRPANVAPIMDALNRDALMMIVMVHAGDTLGILEIFSRYAAYAGRLDPPFPTGVAGVQIDKSHMTGQRTLTEVKRIWVDHPGCRAMGAMLAPS